MRRALRPWQTWLRARLHKYFQKIIQAPEAVDTVFEAYFMPKYVSKAAGGVFLHQKIY